tara:strand:+ start:700 stop:1464 length:765 start_codon:yes stop_codon:yes gene_type:complete
MLSIVTYNVNGIRAALRKGLDQWLKSCNPDIVCLQEIKCNPQQFEESRFNELGYRCFINSAQKPGYSGVAILSKEEPIHIEYGCGIEKIDFEGRIIRADYTDYSVMSVYFPSGTNPLRQAFKMEFLALFYEYIFKLRQDIPNLIISGDYNICHKAIDIHNPKSNKNSSGFLPEEREWITQFLSMGFVDSFRCFNKEPEHYSWWSYRANSRQKNLGWRIDYNMISESVRSYLNRSEILPAAKHSDHCPVLIELAY